MGKFIRSILEPDGAIAADGDETIDLPVNPLSGLLLRLAPLNETSTIANYGLLEKLLTGLDNVRVTHKGASVIDIRGDDLAALIMFWYGQGIWQRNAVETDDDRRCIVLPVMFGGKMYDPAECFPETRKGELQLTLTWDIAATGFDGMRRSIEAIELPEATPDYVQKVTTLAQTFAAVGQNDVDLPIGNVIRGVLCWGTTSFAGATPAPTLGQLSVFKDNMQTHYSAADFEMLCWDMANRGLPFPASFTHIHSGTYTTTVAGDSLEPEVGLDKSAYYGLLDFDPLRDDSYALDTKGAGRVHVRSNAEASEAVRLLPIEKVSVGTYLEA